MYIYICMYVRMYVYTGVCELYDSCLSEADVSELRLEEESRNRTWAIRTLFHLPPPQICAPAAMAKDSSHVPGGGTPKTMLGTWDPPNPLGTVEGPFTDPWTSSPVKGMQISLEICPENSGSLEPQGGGGGGRGASSSCGCP